MHKINTLAEFLSCFNREASVIVDGITYQLNDELLTKVFSPYGIYWSTEDIPPKDVCVRIVGVTKATFAQQLSRRVLLQLCADTLRISLSALEDMLDWEANYMAWHDGGTPDEHHVYPKSLGFTQK